MSKKHAFKTRLRAFRIWQQLGYNPWQKPRAVHKQGGDFYKGAFNSIPFLNNEGKRTITHLMLRPGYMIRDYINGDHERYMAPLTALIVFYAFVTLVSAIVQPFHQFGKTEEAPAKEQVAPKEGKTLGPMDIIDQGEKYLELDLHPELVDTRTKGLIAAVEGSLRSKGITLFLLDFLLLWPAMAISLRRYKVTWSAAAAAAAYSLCLFSFAILVAILVTLGAHNSLGILVLFLLIIIIYRQWLSVSWLKSVGLTLWTAIVHTLLYVLILVVLDTGLLIAAFARGEISFVD